MPLDGRLLIVSNRLPVSVRATAGGIELEAASGGLATGLEAWHRQADALWIGWPGDLPGGAAARADVERQLAGRRVVPVFLTGEEIKRYYDGFANRVLWPLFHYLVDRVPVDAHGWDAYAAVNARFAEQVAAHYRPGDVIWVHDYQLMLLPALLRKRLPAARIGFFLHIPFPSSEVFRVLPWRRPVLRGLLGADLLGFQTFAHQRHFVTSLLHVEGVETHIDRIHLDDRTVRLGVFPMSIDAAAFEALARDPAVQSEAAAIRDEAGGRRIMLGVDRLDYTKGIPRRLLAFERLLAREPALRDQVRYVQIAVPSRENVDSYQSFRRQVEEAVGRINGASATLRSTPVHYLHQSVSRPQLVALYTAADVMMVTPLRDGMNLVAKEFVASRVDGDGVLVLSEFAGAADELGEAVSVNPYDVDALSAAMRDALMMEPEVRQARMRNLRRRVVDYNVHRWAASFIEAVAIADPVCPSVPTATPETIVSALRGARRLALLLDYDGTLVPIARTPDLAVPDPELLSLLAALAARSDTVLHLVSGRPRELLERWFEGLPVALWAEHGTYYRASPNRPWECTVSMPLEWLGKVLPIFEQFAAGTPGSLIERKSASIAWHYRNAPAEFGARQAHELRMLLGDALSNQPLEVVEGKKVIEVRFRGASKAVVAHRVLATHVDAPAILAVADDRTDDDLFGALPEASIRVAVGSGRNRATHRVADHLAVRQVLRAVLQV
jgi:trehalose 6-phosphate synthase/phosphatase